jgi:hypothetical protein
MAILTDDCDINDCSMFMQVGGNGDYYLHLMQYKDHHLESEFKHLCIRFAMSGGCISKHPKVARAIWELYRAMEEDGLNLHPKEINNG